VEISFAFVLHKIVLSIWLILYQKLLNLFYF